MNLVSSPMASPLQDEESYPSRPNTYIWSQNDDQLTVSFLIPDNTKPDVTIEATQLRAGVRGQEPVVKVGNDGIWRSLSRFSAQTL